MTDILEPEPVLCDYEADRAGAFASMIEPVATGKAGTNLIYKRITPIAVAGLCVAAGLYKHGKNEALSTGHENKLNSILCISSLSVAGAASGLLALTFGLNLKLKRATEKTLLYLTKEINLYEPEPSAEFVQVNNVVSSVMLHPVQLTVMTLMFTQGQEVINQGHWEKIYSYFILKNDGVLYVTDVNHAYFNKLSEGESSGSFEDKVLKAKDAFPHIDKYDHASANVIAMAMHVLKVASDCNVHTVVIGELKVSKDRSCDEFNGLSKISTTELAGLLAKFKESGKSMAANSR